MHFFQLHCSDSIFWGILTGNNDSISSLRNSFNSESQFIVNIKLNSNLSITTTNLPMHIESEL